MFNIILIKLHNVNEKTNNEAEKNKQRSKENKHNMLNEYDIINNL